MAGGVAGEGVVAHGGEETVGREGTEDVFGGEEKGLALLAAGAVGNVVGKHGIEKGVQVFPGGGVRRETGGEKGDGRTGGLLEDLVGEAGDMLGGLDFGMVKGGFEARGVNEAASGEGGIEELPDEPVGG